LQIALQTKHPDALQSFLKRYPESSERERVQAEIARLKRSEFDECSKSETGAFHNI
jgi:hypothetical protein